MNDFTCLKTFSKENPAKEWIKKIEAQLELNDNVFTKQINDTLASLILRYRNEVAEQFNPKYANNNVPSKKEPPLKLTI